MVEVTLGRGEEAGSHPNGEVGPPSSEGLGRPLVVVVVEPTGGCLKSGGMSEGGGGTPPGVGKEEGAPGCRLAGRLTPVRPGLAAAVVEGRVEGWR